MSSFNFHDIRKHGYDPIPSLQEKGKSAFNDHPYLTIAIPLLLCYLGLVRYLRHRNINRLKQKYGFTADKDSYKDMTVEQAQEIERNIAEWDFPCLFEFGWIVEFLKVGGTTSIQPLTPLRPSSHMPSLAETVISASSLIINLHSFPAAQITCTLRCLIRLQTNLSYLEAAFSELFLAVSYRDRIQGKRVSAVSR